MNKVLLFINTFKKSHEQEAEDLFGLGYCYYFAIILKERFNSGIIYYIPIYNHFACMIDNKLYDIYGEIIDKEKITLAEPWSEYSKKDKLETSRIFRDCILKI